ncbi:MAG: tRNA (adenosine(37)-N6)-threonylcarbamoyltransferase complex ATPase subunit type 1 TsaE, partial [Proteobacteria bacterium]|nr:tRNA (adenosine(37)-N6)-threonylcarbamoyltransferase complex ATPase subunit type 1 TsaE [Pseudomonadota bacterium]
MQEPFEHYLEDAAATEALGGRLAAHLRGGMVVTLSGDLGAGKTTLVRGMLRALGVSGTVKSPSYALVEEYLFESPPLQGGANPRPPLAGTPFEKGAWDGVSPSPQTPLPQGERGA